LDVQGEIWPSRQDTFFALASFARGNGLNNTGGVSLVPNADDLEDDVKNINGTSRDYLLEAWYRRQLIDSGALSIAITGGLIDATRYLDHNRVANDEITQFMNEAFVTRFFLPSYDPGIAIQTSGGSWHVDMTWMRAQTDSNSNGDAVSAASLRKSFIVNVSIGENCELSVAEIIRRGKDHPTGRSDRQPTDCLLSAAPGVTRVTPLPTVARLNHTVVSAAATKKMVP